MADSQQPQSFRLQHPGSCTGMFWRRAPPGLQHREAGGAQPDWPRNGAVLTGFVHHLPQPHEGDTQWLEVVEYLPPGAGKPAPTPDCWMQFHQGGQLLHPVE
uniref:Uncharacterized protein n=1 Tax=Neobodo designis TaxID=312471 RepID=A0A7S1QIA0_NEODS